jgi:hypothetical protein
MSASGGMGAGTGAGAGGGGSLGAAGSTGITAGNTSSILGTGITTGNAGLDTVIGGGVVSGGTEGVRQGATAIQEGQTIAEQNKGYAANAAEQKGAQQKAHEMTSMLSGDGEGQSSMLAEGGPVHMQSGSFVIPADIVSALGDGSTEAGFRFLEDFFKDEA